MTWELRHARPDGTFVILLNGLPYHVVEADPLFEAVSAAAAGLDLPPEPAPPPIPDAPQPTKAELIARLDALQAQIEALS